MDDRATGEKDLFDFFDGEREDDFTAFLDESQIDATFVKFGEGTFEFLSALNGQRQG